MKHINSLTSKQKKWMLTGSLLAVLGLNVSLRSEQFGPLARHIVDDQMYMTEMASTARGEDFNNAVAGDTATILYERQLVNVKVTSVVGNDLLLEVASGQDQRSGICDSLHICGSGLRITRGTDSTATRSNALNELTQAVTAATDRASGNATERDRAERDETADVTRKCLDASETETGRRRSSSSRKCDEPNVAYYEAEAEKCLDSRSDREATDIVRCYSRQLVKMSDASSNDAAGIIGDFYRTHIKDSLSEMFRRSPNYNALVAEATGNFLDIDYDEEDLNTEDRAAAVELCQELISDLSGNGRAVRSDCTRMAQETGRRMRNEYQRARNVFLATRSRGAGREALLRLQDVSGYTQSWNMFGSYAAPALFETLVYENQMCFNPALEYMSLQTLNAPQGYSNCPTENPALTSIEALNIQAQLRSGQLPSSLAELARGQYRNPLMIDLSGMAGAYQNSVGVFQQVGNPNYAPQSVLQQQFIPAVRQAPTFSPGFQQQINNQQQTGGAVQSPFARGRSI